MKRENIKLAIIIPLYKTTYLDLLLQALSEQADQRFNVYIGDDCSPNDPIPLIDKFNKSLTINYHRFTTRLGHISLTKQWERCLQLVKGEEWVWLLPDDDLPSLNCVEEFYLSLNKANASNIKVFRFPIDIIDDNGHLIKRNKESTPDLESNYEYFSRAMMGEVSTSLGNNIFHKQSLLQTGGFVDFVKAWGSDQATVLRASSGGMIYFLRDAKLGFRMSSENISSNINDGYDKITARIMFAKWLKKNESIFPVNPSKEFYYNFARKQDYYFVYIWKFNFRAWVKLYFLRIICLNSFSPFPVLMLLMKKWLKK